MTARRSAKNGSGAVVKGKQKVNETPGRSKEELAHEHGRRRRCQRREENKTEAQIA